MRILLATGSFPPMACGVGEYTAWLARALAGRPGISVAVLTGTEAAAATSPGVELFPVIRDWKLSDVSRVRRVCEEWRPDVVHLQYPTQGYRNYLAWQVPGLARLLGHPVVQTWHEYVRPELQLPEAALALASREVIVVRSDLERRLPRWIRPLLFRSRFHYIPNASTIPRVSLGDEERHSVRERLGARGRSLLAFFGFPFQNKGLDDVLELLDPSRHHLVLVGKTNEADPYQRALLGRFREPPLEGAVTVTGFLEPGEAARVLAAADAVVLPFRAGGGSWNTSLKAAALQGTFLLTTSTERHGYVPEHNAYYARPGDVADLAAGLEAHLGTRVDEPSPEVAGPTWSEVADRHLDVYRAALG
jgi:glycosyltransferase involved in cell wall biosynthesis